MALFSSLSERLNHIFSKLTKHGKLTELEIKGAMREVRVALLEADVNIFVAKKFIADVSEKAVGQEILKSLNPAQQVIKIVNDELIALMGSANAKLEVADRPPTVIMMCGLQGAGKTTLCGKLAVLLKKQGKKPLLVAGDIYRPAAINQLQVVGGKAGVEVFERGTQNPVKTAKQAIDHARSMGYDTVIIDTAGRLHIDDALMTELENIRREVSPNEILLTVDAMTGQDAVNVAETFNKRLDVTGVILTKLDGDTRGGAASPSRRSRASPSSSSAWEKSSPISSPSIPTAWLPAFWAWETFCPSSKRRRRPSPKSRRKSWKRSCARHPSRWKIISTSSNPSKRWAASPPSWR